VRSSLFAIALLAAAPAAAPALELTKSVALETREVKVAVRYDDDAQKRWAETVLAVAAAGLRPLEKAAGFACPVEAFEISYAAEAAATGGLDAKWQGGGKLAVRQKVARGGYHGHAVLKALAQAWSEKVATEAWLEESLAHFYVWIALRELPRVYDSRTYRDELVQEAAKAPEAPLDGWKPGGSAEASAGSAGALAAWPQAARGTLFLCCIERRLGEGTIARASNAQSGEKPGTTADFAKAVGTAAGKPALDLFYGWALAITDPETQKPALKTADIRDEDDDSLLNFEEAEVGTDPKLNDTDGDGLLDGEEVFDTHTDPKAKDAPRAPVAMKCDVKAWMRTKKFVIQDKAGDAKGGQKGADLRKVDLCADGRFVYFLIEADALSPEVSYNIAFDNDSDGIFDYYVGFRGDRNRWLGDSHGVKDLSWCEWKNHRGIVLRTSGEYAEIRIPLAAIGDPHRFTLLVYTTGKGSAELDTCLRTPVDLDRWRH
jgi:hypothetical protein